MFTSMRVLNWEEKTRLALTEWMDGWTVYDYQILGQPKPNK